MKCETIETRAEEEDADEDEGSSWSFNARRLSLSC